MNNDSWHLSKSVPVTFIMAIVCQTVALVWYVSALDASVAINTRDIARHDLRIQATEKSSQEQAVMLARMDANINAIRDMIEAMARRGVD